VYDAIRPHRIRIMLEICALASGSNGNCYYIGNGSEAILVDAGISRRQVLERMAQRGLNPEKLRAIFISHEHADHFRGIVLLRTMMQLNLAALGLNLKGKMWAFLQI
jgi:phosphoribosyl 1,2-cyclic phosphodiesterase